MKEISKIRRKNLRNLYEKFENVFKSLEKNRNKRYSNIMFCKAINLSPSMYNQLINIKLKPFFNELYARKIEKQCHLPANWFDIDHDNITLEKRTINYKQFIAATQGLDKFINSGIIAKDNTQLIEKIRQNLFIHLSQATDTNGIKLDTNNFLDFMK